MTRSIECNGRLRPTERYRPAARWLHWITALLVAAMFTLGIWMIYFKPADARLGHRLFNLHESTGVAIWVIVLGRLWLRRRWPPPPLPADTPAPIRLAARLNHLGLYALLLAMPVIGFLGNNAQGVALVWYELVPLPSPLGKDEATARILSAIHWWGALLLLAMVGAHLAGAAYHGWIRRDGVVRRML
jgi:cytochrome b561